MLAWSRRAVTALAALYLVAGVVAFCAMAGSAQAGLPALLREMELVLFVPLPVLFGVAVILRTRIALVALTAPFLAWTLSYGPQFAPNAAPVNDRPAFRVLSFNVGDARGLTRPASIIRAIQQADPDIVCLVEAPANALTTIGTPLRSAFPFQESSSSIAVFSRYPLADARRHLLQSGTKDSLKVTLDIDSRPVDLTTVHFQRSDTYAGLTAGAKPLVTAVRRFSTETRDVAMAELVALLRAEGGTRILVGDLNMTPTSRAHRILSSELRDAFAEAGWGFGHTYPVFMRPIPLDLSVPLLRIDYIFHSKDLVARQAWVGADGSSDHLPVVADLAVR